MVPEQIPEFAVESDLGADVFRRIETPNERRHHYECIATVIWNDDGAQVIDYHDDARENPARMIAVATRMRQTETLAQDFSLSDPRRYPSPDSPRAQLDLFQYLDFFRHWQIAGMEFSRVKAIIRSGGAVKPPEISRLFRLLLDFNQTAQAQFFISAFFPYLLEISQRKQDDSWQNAAYALRLIGDLQRRAGHALPALHAFEASIALGDNAFRRSLAVQAAFAAGDTQATLKHLRAYERQWRLPERLAHIKTAVASSETGDIP